MKSLQELKLEGIEVLKSYGYHDGDIISGIIRWYNDVLGYFAIGAASYENTFYTDEQWVKQKSDDLSDRDNGWQLFYYEVYKLPNDISMKFLAGEDIFDSCKNLHKSFEKIGIFKNL